MRITTGKVSGAQKVLVYGPEGIGKSTFASQFPDPLFIDTEGSTKHMDVKRLDRPTSWTMLLEQVAWVRKNPGACATLVIDTADWAEQLCIAHVCAKSQKEGIEDFGYGKGYTYLAEEFGRLLNALSDLVDAGVHVVLTAHAQIRKFEQPDETAAYDRWELKLGKKTAPLVKEWADMVLFVNYKTFVVKDDKTKKATAQGGKRVMYTMHTPTWDAKNRHDLPDEIPFEKGAFAIADAIAFEKVAAPVPEGVTVIPLATPDAVPAVAAAIAGAVDEPENVVPLHAAPVQAPEATMPPAGLPAHLKALYDLMAPAGVTVIDVQRAVADRGYFPIATPIEKYPVDFVEGVLVAKWGDVLALIADLKKVPF
ncbi:MAG: ATP-binding protein [Coriobacteriia bacterium]